MDYFSLATLLQFKVYFINGLSLIDRLFATPSLREATPTGRE
ncbi:hypothetical protein [Nostoc linckia]|nr:hypothetical protein [Nostoc linckia]